jgi:CRP-like cAMP-binding protein
MTANQFKKGSHIVRSGEICDRIHIIRKGLVRGYFNYNENEITTWVSVDNEMVTSISGYFKNEPALENIQCIEDTFTESLSYEDMHFALKHFKEMTELYRVLMERYYLSSEFRSFMARIPNARDRFEYFKSFTHQEILNRLPKKYLASLLNIRPETLSRLDLKQVEI